MKLRDYQQQAVDAVRKKLTTERCALVATCVGSGKSLIIAELAKDYRKAVIVQPAQELVLQNYRKLVDSGLNCTMIDGVHKGDWNADYIFTTPQTLSKHVANLIEPDIIFADEVQYGYIGKMWSTIRKHWDKCKLVGLTATPRYYEQGVVYSGGWMYSVTTCKSLAADIFGEPVIEISRAKLRELGYGSDIKIERVNYIPQINDMHVKNYTMYFSMVNRHLEELFGLLKTIPNALIYCDSQAHAELLNKQSNGDIHLLFGKTPKGERAQLIQDFLDNKVRFIATVGCGKIGLDLPNLTSIIILTNVSNPDLLEQMIGRLNRGTCAKTCYYNSHINTTPPEVGKSEWIKIKKLGGSPIRKKK